MRSRMSPDGVVRHGNRPGCEEGEGDFIFGGNRQVGKGRQGRVNRGRDTFVMKRNKGREALVNPLGLGGRGRQCRHDEGGGQQHQQTDVRMRCRYQHGVPEGRQVLAAASCGAADRAGTRDSGEPVERGCEPRKYGKSREAALWAPVRRGGYRTCRAVQAGLSFMTLSKRLAACGVRRAASHCNQRTPRRCQGFSGVRRSRRNRQVRGLALASSSVASCPCPLSLGPTRLVRQTARSRRRPCLSAARRRPARLPMKSILITQNRDGV